MSAVRDPKTGLTPKMEAFALAFIETGNASEAYRRSYNASKMKPRSIWGRASQLLKDAQVKAMVERLREPARKALSYDLTKAMQEAEEARLLALELGIPSAAVSAAALKAKMNGLLVEERRNERQPLNDLPDEQLESYAARLADQHAAIVGQGADPAGTRKPH